LRRRRHSGEWQGHAEILCVRDSGHGRRPWSDPVGWSTTVGPGDESRSRDGAGPGRGGPAGRMAARRPAERRRHHAGPAPPRQPAGRGRRTDDGGHATASSRSRAGRSRVRTSSAAGSPTWPSIRWRRTRSSPPRPRAASGGARTPRHVSTPAWPKGLSQAVGALAITSTGTLYAGTGESNPGGGSVTFGGKGIYTVVQRHTWKVARPDRQRAHQPHSDRPVQRGPHLRGGHRPALHGRRPARGLPQRERRCHVDAGPFRATTTPRAPRTCISTPSIPAASMRDVGPPARTGFPPLWRRRLRHLPFDRRGHDVAAPGGRLAASRAQRRPDRPGHGAVGSGSAVRGLHRCRRDLHVGLHVDRRRGLLDAPDEHQRHRQRAVQLRLVVRPHLGGPGQPAPRLRGRRVARGVNQRRVHLGLAELLPRRPARHGLGPERGGPRLPRQRRRRLPVAGERYRHPGPPARSSPSRSTTASTWASRTRTGSSAARRTTGAPAPTRRPTPTSGTRGPAPTAWRRSSASRTRTSSTDAASTAAASARRTAATAPRASAAPPRRGGTGSRRWFSTPATPT
jgi:hypothetical protein